MNILQRFFESSKSGMRAFGQKFVTTDPKLTRSIVLNLASQVNPDDRYTGLVFACIDAIQSQACQAKPRLMHYDSNGEAVRNFDHDLIKLLYKPNTQQTWYDLIKWTVGYRETRGTAYWYLAPAVSGSKKPVAIYVLNPDRMTPVYSDEANVSEVLLGWEYTTPVGGLILRFAPEEIISFPYFSPYSQTLGIGPLQAATIEQDNDLAAQNYLTQLYQNGAMPSGVLSSDQELTNDTVERVRGDWKKTYEGQANIGKTLILEQGLKYERLSLSMQDLAFTEGRKDAREAILQIFRVPKSLLGSSATITRANAEADVYSFAKNKIQPMMEEIFGRMNYYLLPKFGLNPASDKLKFDSLVPEDRELELKENDTYLKTGVLTINEVRSRKGLEDVPWGDQPFQLPEAGIFGSQTDTAESDNTGSSNQSRQLTRASGGRFDHTAYKLKFDRADRALVRRHQKEIQNKYDQAAELITKHLERYWPDEAKRSLNAEDLRAVVRAMPGELNSVMPVVENLILEGITTVLSEGVFRASGLTYRYLLGDDGEGMFLQNPLALDWVLENALSDAGSISKTMKKVAQEVVSDALINGDSTFTLGKNLQAKFRDMSGWKAEQIARTETHKAMSYAAHQTALDTNLLLVKKWDDSGDDRVCEHCRENSAAGWIPMSDAYPHGETSPEDEHPNGRCVEYFEPAEWHK